MQYFFGILREVSTRIWFSFGFPVANELLLQDFTIGVFAAAPPELVPDIGISASVFPRIFFTGFPKISVGLLFKTSVEIYLRSSPRDPT